MTEVHMDIPGSVKDNRTDDLDRLPGCIRGYEKQQWLLPHCSTHCHSQGSPQHVMLQTKCWNYGGQTYIPK